MFVDVKDEISNTLLWIPQYRCKSMSKLSVCITYTHSIYFHFKNTSVKKPKYCHIEILKVIFIYAWITILESRSTTYVFVKATNSWKWFRCCKTYANRVFRDALKARVTLKRTIQQKITNTLVFYVGVNELLYNFSQCSILIKIMPEQSNQEQFPRLISIYFSRGEWKYIQTNMVITAHVKECINMQCFPIKQEYYWTTKRTSNIFNKMFTYNLLTPRDFPIDAREIIANKNIKNGVTSTEQDTDTIVHNNAMLAQYPHAPASTSTLRDSRYFWQTDRWKR